MNPVPKDEQQYHFFGLWLMALAKSRNLSLEQFSQTCGLYPRALAEIVEQPGVRAEPEICIALAQVTGEPLEKIFKIAGIEYQIITNPRSLRLQKYFEELTPELQEECLALIGHCHFDYQAKVHRLAQKRLGFPVRWSFYEYLKDYFDTVRSNAAEFGLFTDRTSFADTSSQHTHYRRRNQHARAR